jgi:hypothetical protein
MNALCVTRRAIRNTTDFLRVRSSHLLLCCLALFVAGGLVYAGVTASISGTVTDSTGAAIAGAAVTATNIATGGIPTNKFSGFLFLPVAGAWHIHD